VLTLGTLPLTALAGAEGDVGDAGGVSNFVGAILLLVVYNDSIWVLEAQDLYRILGGWWT
jgi:hypothetical protein